VSEQVEQGVIVVRSRDYDDPAAVALRAAMTAEMTLRYWDELTAGPPPPPGLAVQPHEAVWNGVALVDDRLPVGHALLRWYTQPEGPSIGLGPGTLELKRMYVVPSHRGSGVGRILLEASERAGTALGAHSIVLHTGPRQPDAVRSYHRAGYLQIPVFPPYHLMTGPVCFRKPLPPATRTTSGRPGGPAVRQRDVGPAGGSVDLPT